jgi:glycosyltransferase involved in cell wall biosynthesis
MRILFINKASLTHEGGAEIRSKEIGKRLVLLGHDVVVFAAKTNIKEPKFELYHGIQLYHKKILPDWLIRIIPAPHYFTLAAANLLLMFHLYYFLKINKFDLIREDISPFPPSGLLALSMSSVTKRIAVVHNLEQTLRGWYKFYGPIYGFAGFLMYRLLTSGRLKYDLIICDAKWVISELKEYPKISGKLIYIPNGVDLKHFYNNKAKHRYSKAIRLLSVGRLVEIKGYRYLLEALSYLKSKYPQLKLDIFGNGPLKDQLIRLARQLAVHDIVKFRSPVSYEEMPEIYNEYDYFVMPSVSEGLPLSLLEAIASKLPIIATDIPGINEVVGRDTATLALPENSLDLAYQLIWAFEHPDDIFQKIESAYSILKHYDWDIITQHELEGTFLNESCQTKTV